MQIPYQQKKKKFVAPEIKVRKVTITRTSQPVEIECVQQQNEDSVDVDPSPGSPLQNVAFSFKESLYSYYCGQLFNHGIVRFRIRSLHKQVLLLNDYNPETGDFLVRKCYVSYY